MFRKASPSLWSLQASGETGLLFAGNVRAQASLGFQYDEGEGVVLDKSEAVRYYRLAAQQGLRNAQFNLANSLSKGDSCDKSPVQAVQWMRRAIELGYAVAQAELARWYMFGECGLPTNYKEAMRLAKLGAEAGNAPAMSHIGFLIVKGWGVAKDDDEACKGYRHAAALGLEVAKNILRKLARTGHAPFITAVRELGLGQL